MFTYEDAVNAISNIPRFVETPTVKHAVDILDAIGRPDSKMKIIHVAGTNGKGSICAFLTHMLIAQGYRVGTFTSPHLVKMNERIQINREPISDEQFLQAYLTVREACKDIDPMNYFEHTFAMAMTVFAQSDLDYVILEVGLGGALDGTNAIQAPICSVIASISFDHMEVLGNSIEEIARAKAGIIKKETPVVYDANNQKAAVVIEAQAEKMNTKAYAVSDTDYVITARDTSGLKIQAKTGKLANREITIPFVAQYQAVNTMIALRVMEVCGKLDTDKQIEDALRGLSQTKWPGRMQQVLHGVYLDGAHNEDGIAKFTQAVNAIPCEGRKILLFSAVKEKDTRLMAKHLGQDCQFDCIFITEIDNDRQLDANALVNRLKEYYNGPITVCPKIAEAFEMARKEKAKSDLLFIAGSLYLAGSIMELL
jgi:dihydrofolate synthase/folylpolyglutamate synthase